MALQESEHNTVVIPISGFREVCGGKEGGEGGRNSVWESSSNQLDSSLEDPHRLGPHGRGAPSN